MENIIYSSPETAPDNLTIWRRLPYNTSKSAFFATNYGAILRRMKKGITVVPLEKNKSAIACPGSIRHGKDKRGGTFLINSVRSPLHNKRIHRLVASVFCECPDIFCNQVDHIDNNPANQRADNLRWCTDKQNKEFYREIKSGQRIITNLQKSLFYAN